MIVFEFVVINDNLVLKDISIRWHILVHVLNDGGYGRVAGRPWIAAYIPEYALALIEEIFWRTIWVVMGSYYATAGVMDVQESRKKRRRYKVSE